MTNKWMEKAGMSAGVLCAVHCAATPIVLAAAPVLAPWLEMGHELELALLLLGFPLAVLVLGRDYKNTHRKSLPLKLAAFGFACIYFVEMVMHEAWWISIAGAFALLAAYYINHKYTAHQSEEHSCSL